MTTYKTTITSIAVHINDESPIFGESTTTVRIDDDGGGVYIVLEQSGIYDLKPGIVKLNQEELPVIMDVAQRLLDQETLASSSAAPAPQPAQAQQPVSGADELLALARAALEPFADLGAWLFARNLPDDTPMVDVVHINNVKTTLTRGHFKAAYSAATDIDAALDAAVAADRAQAAPAAPQPAQQERKPLTDEQIMSAIRSPGYDLEDMPDSWAFTLGVRFAERHHGIRKD